MTILYSNGCSYTANFELERKDRYPELIAGHFGWQISNCAIPGNCNSIIMRRAMRDCINLLKHNEPIVALIQLTHQHRFEYAGTPTKENHWKYGLPIDRLIIDHQIDDNFESINPLDEKNWPKEIVDYAKQHIALQNTDALNTNVLYSVAGLASFFQTNNIQYFIYAGPSYWSEDIVNNTFYQYLLKDPQVLDLKNFNMLALTGHSSHPTVDGMQAIADYFINLINPSNKRN
jgi:hypothetical protein